MSARAGKQAAKAASIPHRPEETPVSRLLAAVPHRNEAVTSQPAGDGLLVCVPMRRPRWLVPPLSWLIPFSHVRKVQLDAPGKAVLELCDGHRTVEEVIETFAAENKLSFREGQLAVTQFLRELLRRGIIVLVGMET
jgi:hypothetical protein